MEITRGKIGGAQKIVIYGPEGIGKSTFASHFPNPVFIDTEGSTKHMDVARTPKPSSWTMLMEQVKYFKANPSECGTLVIDTADWAETLCEEEICAKNHKAGIEDFGYGKGYVYLAEEFGRLLNLLEDLVGLGINVVITAHSQMRKFEQPDEMGSYDRWELKLEKKTAPLLKEWADMVLFANYKTFVVKTEDKKNKAQGGKRVMYTSHHPCWDAKNRHGLEPELNFDYTEIAHCISSGQEDTPKQSASASTPNPAPTSPKMETTRVPGGTPEPKKQEQPPTISAANLIAEGVPKALADLMVANQVTIEEIQAAVSGKGYYPENTPLQNYDPDFIAGVLVCAWPQVFDMIKNIRDDILLDDIPF